MRAVCCFQRLFVRLDKHAKICYASICPLFETKEKIKKGVKEMPDRLERLDETTNKAVRNIQDAKDWIEEIITASLTDNPTDWEEIARDCDALVDSIDAVLYREQRKEQGR